MSRISHALSLLTCEEYLALDEGVHRLCRPVTTQPKPKHVACYSTWKPSQSWFFTLIKAERCTVVYCHENGRAYQANPSARLAAACPLHTAFLCQWCVDQCKEGKVPHLLVFDVATGRQGGAPARGEELRALARHLPLPLCVVQWAGETEALESFVKCLPHAVECFLGLSEDPFCLYRHMQIKVPTREYGADAIRFLGDVIQ
jgi:predicted CxxxxCH...CXXCH cytochrome family protein